tara:strand:- start:13 stop:432 length:420 start_codon:yes stop_codon:yes gene_type:complete
MSKQAAPQFTKLLSLSRPKPQAASPAWQILITGRDDTTGKEFDCFSDTSGWRFIDLWSAMSSPERRGINQIMIELVPSRGIGWAQRFVSRRDGGLMAAFEVAARGFARRGTEVKPMSTWSKHLTTINKALIKEGGERNA